MEENELLKAIAAYERFSSTKLDFGEVEGKTKLTFQQQATAGTKHHGPTTPHQDCPVCMDQVATTSLPCDPKHRLWLSCGRDPRVKSCPL